MNCNIDNVAGDINTHEQLNHYHAESFYGEENAAIIKKVEKIVKTAPYLEGVGDLWFDKSDSMTDYFHTAYYFSIHVGKWDKNHTRLKDIWVKEGFSAQNNLNLFAKNP